MRIMKKNILLHLAVILLLFISFSSCGDSQLNKDIDIIDGYISSHHLDTCEIKVINNLYYVELKEGSGKYLATEDDSIVIAYSMKLANDVEVDYALESDPLGVEVSNMLKGVQTGICQMKVGGHAILLIPSSLGYGSYSIGGYQIPPNSVLVFDVTLLKLYRKL